MFGKRFIRLSVKKMQNFQSISLKKLYTEFLCPRQYLSHMVLQCWSKNLVWFAGLDISECHRESQRQSYAPAAAGSISH